MIYPYTYFDHKVQKFHLGLSYFFERLFELDLMEYDKNQLLEAPMIEIVSASKTRLETPLKEIVRLYHALNAQEKEIIKKSFEDNNKIEDLCKGEGQPKKYTELPNDIKQAIENFWKSLWEGFSSKEGLNQHLKVFCGEVLEHFHEFKKQPDQKTRVCPFCGINGLKPSDDIYRNAYDHYLPKSLYPFTSVNFKNLVPICHECNSDEKKATDTLFKDGNRRIAFYPYDSAIDPNKLSVTITRNQAYNSSNNSTLMKKDFKYQYDILIDGKNDERIDTWDEIFRVKEKYQRYLSDFETEWFEQLKSDFKESIEDGITFERFKTKTLDKVSRELLVNEKGIIKKAYYQYLFGMDGFEEDLKFTAGIRAA